MKEALIRKAVKSDLPYLYEICLKTGDSGNDASHLYTDPYLLGHYYVAPYVIYPGGIAYIVEHEYRPQCYIVAVPDTAAYRRWLEDEWLPPLRQQCPLPSALEKLPTEKDRQILELIHKKHMPVEAELEERLKNYPAHLHIDLLPGIQRKGYGSKLMERLFSELSKQGIPGLHLGVGKKRPGAIAFYHSAGFTVLKETEQGLTLGKRV